MVFARIGIALAAMVALPAWAGPLNPPSGAVMPTARPLAEVEPRIAVGPQTTPGDADSSPSTFKITAPGSYYLTADVVGEATKHGIEITSDDVTLDLMGFSVRGVAGARSGVRIASLLRNVTVRDGSITDWPTGGLDASSADEVSVLDVRVMRNTGIGIFIDSGTIDRCVAQGNTSTGIRAAQGAAILRCFAQENATGIDAGIIASVTDCSVVSNTGRGIVAGGNCVVSRCTVQQNGGDGITLNFGSLAVDCVSRSNGGHGFIASNASIVRGCTADRNSIDGIRLASACSALNNSCTSNALDGTGAGVHATGSDNRVEGNNCIANTFGVQIDAAGNVIVGNTCSGNTSNFSIVAANVHGPVVDRRTPGGVTFTGSSAASTMNTTDPFANFAY